MDDAILTDELWTPAGAADPGASAAVQAPGRKRADDRAALEGILWVLRTGVGWNQVPTALFGVSGATCWRRLDQWRQAGVWQQRHELLLEELRAAGKPDLSAGLRRC